MLRFNIGFAVLALALPLSAQHEAESDKTKKNPAIGDPKAIAAGQKLYMTSCAACHGPKGQGGRGPNLRQRGAWHPMDDNALFETIKKGIPGTDMPALNQPEAQLWEMAAFVRSLTAPAAEANLAGNPQAGETLYWSARAGCSNCHGILGRGGALGPDLSRIGAIKPSEEILESIIDPDADGFPRYKGVTAITRDGRAVKGVVRNRSNYSVQIHDAQGNLHLLNTADLKEMTISPHSPMPRDFAKRLSRQELEDLLAFLARQTVRPYESEKK